MAADTPTKRASVLVAGSFFPGRVGLPPEPDGSDADGTDERAFLVYRYSGIDAAAPTERKTRLRSRRGVGL